MTAYTPFPKSEPRTWPAGTQVVIFETGIVWTRDLAHPTLPWSNSATDARLSDEAVAQNLGIVRRSIRVVYP